jgi:hypothetical protein
VETLRAQSLDFTISHRFGAVNSGAANLWGLDDFANIRLGLAYGLTDHLTVAVGRSRLDKAYDAYAKWRILRQETGPGAFPFTLTALAGVVANPFPWNEAEQARYAFKHRLSYHYQLLLARRFGPVSLQLMPTLVHRNLTAYHAEPNTLFALGMGGRWQLSGRLALLAEAYPRFGMPEDLPRQNYLPLAVGLDIQTGLHVFQLHFTNSPGLNERQFIAETYTPLSELRFGFNINRVFFF